MRVGGREGGGWHVFVKRLRRRGWPHRQLQYQRVGDLVNTVLRGIHPVTEMNAGYTGGDIDLLRIHSRDDMDKCKIYSAVDRGGRRGSVRIYSGEKA